MSICYVGFPRLPQRRPARVFVSCYWVVTTVITAVYTSNLIAFVGIRKPVLPVNNLEELASHHEYQAGMDIGGAVYDLFRVAIFITRNYRKKCLFCGLENRLSPMVIFVNNISSVFVDDRPPNFRSKRVSVMYMPYLVKFPLR